MFLDKIALVLAIIGGLNWGSIGIFQFDLVGFLFGGQSSTFSRVIFILVGLAAIAHRLFAAPKIETAAF